MTIMLERAGFEVTSVSLSAEFLKQAKEGHFDLYLLDHTFPDSSGVSVCRAPRAFDLVMPILFYSARAMAKEKEEAINAGAQDYLIKPNDLFNVAGHVAKWIEAAKKGSRN